jgi:hypothetical protein
MLVTDLVTKNPEALVDCTMDTMTRRNGGLDGIRYGEACDPNTIECINQTNELGVVRFDGYKDGRMSRQVPGTWTLTAIPLNFDNGFDANAFKSNIMNSAEHAFTLSITDSDINMAPFWVKPGEKVRSIYRYTPEAPTEDGYSNIFSPDESKDKGCLDHQHNTTGFPEDVLLASDWNSSLRSIL